MGGFTATPSATRIPMFTRCILTLLLLCATSLAQYTVVFDGHAAQVQDGEFAKLLMSTDDGPSWRGDVTVHDDEVVVMNGALENYVGTIEGTLIIADATDGAVLFEDEVTVVDGCGFVWHREPLRWSVPDQRAQDFLDRYYAGGPDVEIWPGNVLFFNSAGPNPDHEDPGSTGSMRVSWNRYDAGYIIYARQLRGMPDVDSMWTELVRWGLTDWDRSQNFYSADNGYRSWKKADYPNSVLGAYRADVTFNNTYGMTEFFGRPLGNADGNWPLDTQHSDNAMSTVLYAMTGSWAAAKAAENDCHAVFGQHMTSGWNFTAQRAGGWPLRCAALYYGVTGDDIVVPYIETMLARIETVQEQYPGFSFVRKPWANQASSGGYIHGDTWFMDFVDDVNEVYDTDFDPLELSRGSAVWQEGILGISCLLAHEFGPTNLKGRFRMAATRCAYTIYVNAAQPKFTPQTIADYIALGGPSEEVPIQMLEPVYPTNDVGVTIFQAQTVGGRALDFSSSGIKGTANGTVQPFAFYFYRLFPGPMVESWVLPVGQAMVDHLYEVNYWGSGCCPEGYLLDRGLEWFGYFNESNPGVYPDKNWDPED